MVVAFLRVLLYVIPVDKVKKSYQTHDSVCLERVYGTQCNVDR